MSGRRSHYRDRGFSRHLDNLGTAETLRQLREIGEHVVNAAKEALKEGVDEIVADAKSRCPVRTGRLRNSIKATPNRSATSYQISANAQSDDGFYYGPVVEFSPKPEFTPFLYPALDANVGRIYGNIRAAINHAIQMGH